MSRTIFCRKYKKELKGLDRPMMPGAMGQEIFDNISEQAWKEWQSQQTMLINEKQLNMINADDRNFLKEQMEKFFNNEDYEHAEGYVPPAV
jgi:Fe-S cluster biosynthesis and repair protein YggX